MCPNGTYGNRTNLQSSSQCTLCTPGKYCFSSGLIQPTADCAQGYVCNGGAYSPTPTDASTGNSCPSGYYCPLGTYAPIPCPLGSYSSTRGNPNIGSCLSCTAGAYCSQIGATSVSGNCSAGYVCS